MTKRSLFVGFQERVNISLDTLKELEDFVTDLDNDGYVGIVYNDINFF